MAGITPNGIRYPDGASKAKDLGFELDQMAHDIDVYVGDQIDSENPLFVQEAEEAVDAALAAARIMREQGAVADLNAVPAISGVLTANIETLNTPYDGVWTVVHQRVDNSDQTGTQIAIGATAATDGEVWTRRLAGGTWQPWVQVIRTPELDARITDLPDELNLATIQRCVHRESGRWYWDGPDDPAATHYVVRRDGRWVIVSTPFPTPSPTEPIITWN